LINSQCSYMVKHHVSIIGWDGLSWYNGGIWAGSPCNSYYWFSIEQIFVLDDCLHRLSTHPSVLCPSIDTHQLEYNLY